MMNFEKVVLAFCFGTWKKLIFTNKILLIILLILVLWFECYIGIGSKGKICKQAEASEHCIYSDY